MDKNKEILDKQKRQSQLKKEVIEIKKKIPSLIMGFIFFIAISLYFLEDKFYHFFGNNVKLIIGSILLLCFLFLFYLYKKFKKVNNKEKEAKVIGAQLYKLMKLDAETNNE